MRDGDQVEAIAAGQIDVDTLVAITDAFGASTHVLVSPGAAARP